MTVGTAQGTLVTNASGRDDSPDGETHGKLGVLAYDPVEDRIQCHACGRWFRKLVWRHLERHGLTIAEYKELYGLNAGTPLEVPSITERRRAANERHQGWRNLTTDWQFPKGHALSRRGQVRAQFRLEHFTSDIQKQRARVWTDEDMIEYLRTERDRLGGYLRQEDLTRNRPGSRGHLPSRNAVIERFGSWERICELLHQPYRLGAPLRSNAWSNRGYAYKTLVGAYQGAIRTSVAGMAATVTIAPDIVPGITVNPRFWTDEEVWCAYEEVERAGNRTEHQKVPDTWKRVRGRPRETGDATD